MIYLAATREAYNTMKIDNIGWLGTTYNIADAFKNVAIGSATENCISLMALSNKTTDSGTAPILKLFKHQFARHRKKNEIQPQQQKCPHY